MLVHGYKFEPRATQHVFIGYPFGTKGYKVLSLIAKKIHVSRDVSFHENVFPFLITLDIFFSSILKCVSFIDFVNDVNNNTQVNNENNLGGAGPMNNEMSSVTTSRMSPNGSPITSSPPASPSASTSNNHSLPDFNDHSPQTHNTPTLRRTQREIKTHAFLNDYIHVVPKLRSNSCIPSLNALLSKYQFVFAETLIHDS